MAADPRVEPLHRAHCEEPGCRADSTWVGDLAIADAHDRLRVALTADTARDTLAGVLMNAEPARPLWQTTPSPANYRQADAVLDALRRHL